MHDLDPQDQPQRDLSDGAAPTEEEADLSALDAEALATEATREVLRDQRQARQMRQGHLAVEVRERTVALGVLVVAVMIAGAVIATGLLRESEGLVRAGLLGFCVICGSGLYRLLSRWSKHSP